MKREEVERMTVLKTAASAFVGFVVVAEAVLLAPVLFNSAITVTALGADEVLSLLTGATTAAGLSAIALQWLQSRNELRSTDQRRSLEYALRADALHHEFNSPEMRRHRDLAYPLLKSVRNKPEALERLCRYWLFEEDNTKLSESLIQSSVSADQAKKLFDEQSASLSSMVAFYVRLSSHLRCFEDQIASADQAQVESAIGPFFVSYWANAGLEPFVKECARLHKIQQSPFGCPYFIAPLQWLFTSREVPMKRVVSNPSAIE